MSTPEPISEPVPDATPATAPPEAPASRPPVRTFVRLGFAIVSALVGVGLLVAYAPTTLSVLGEGYPRGERTFELVRKEWAANWAFAATGSGAVWIAAAEHFRRGKWMLAGALVFAAVVVLCSGIPDR